MPATLVARRVIVLPCVDCSGTAIAIEPPPVSELGADVQGVLSTVMMAAKAKAALQGVRLELEPGASPVTLIPAATLSTWLGVRCADCAELHVTAAADGARARG